MKSALTLLAAFFLLFSTPVAYAEQIETLAKQAILVDTGTGVVLLDKNADERMPTSSMSKVMSLYVIFDALKQGRLQLEDEISVSEKAWRMEGSKMFIKVGTKVKVEELIRGVAIQSGNDAVVALAESVSGTEEAFADAMNVKAAELGLANSHFVNASGWPDPDHYSTPRDLATLAQRIITDFPEHYHYFSEKEFTYNKIRQQNRDPLLGRVQGADGIKTGHTEVAGYGLIGSAQRDGRRLILVVNGLPDEKARGDEGARLMEWGFKNFETKKIISKGEIIDSAKVWLGDKSAVPLSASSDMTVVLPRTQRAQLKLTLSYQEPLKAPVKKGEQAALLRVELPGQKPVEMPLLAGEDVARKGVFGRVADRLGYLLTGMY